MLFKKAVANGETMTLARSTAVLLFLLCGLTQAQQLPNIEPDARITYDRFNNVTWYETGTQHISKFTFMEMEAMFSCPGNTGEQPCRPSAVILQFTYFPSRGDNFFDQKARNAIAIADGRRLPLGQMAVSYERVLSYGDFGYKGVLPISLAAFRQLAAADSLELAIGRMAFTVNSEQIRILGSFYNMAVLNAKQTTTPKRGKPRRRKL